ncbi:MULTISPECIES: DNA-directed RNA polymerase subunit beta [Pontibacillus]|uniref:DNA-directed RNA polymerase subunit beta n=1 Tax=Pontibacillus chungwhensis TaxID=265426 RepID=A0ABY8V1W5_9BACI|nr:MULTISPECIES: DNA-directed RNA polymerase subunit beta [Pontibacillus]MCD5324087.1 DNA-directed RNA polymerase subunit beta [Pontibacillus sp. HN14]WIF97856.1 DNA-directed RNA polymerase subunit beta [Pontibacillus chungwhensis]
MPEKKQSEPTSRTERREIQKEQQNQEKTKSQASKETDKVKKQDKEKKPERYRRRVFPIWLRIIVVLVICALALVGGVMIGYGVIGDGNPTDALKLDTWQHIIDIVTKTE